MIDEFPILFIAAACAQGTTTVRGAAELRVKRIRPHRHDGHWPACAGNQSG
ncbi:MAG: hypothetical protein R3F10_06220 [Lysobacteraceae bacterium]